MRWLYSLHYSPTRKFIYFFMRLVNGVKVFQFLLMCIGLVSLMILYLPRNFLSLFSLSINIKRFYSPSLCPIGPPPSLSQISFHRAQHQQTEKEVSYIVLVLFLFFFLYNKGEINVNSSNHIYIFFRKITIRTWNLLKII